jgi:hypothetical protein
MPIHRQNSYAPKSKRRSGRHEAQSRRTGQQNKEKTMYIQASEGCEEGYSAN